MKFVKRISLFFIYSITVFGSGIISGMAVSEYFYPGRYLKEEVEVKEEIPMMVSLSKEPVFCADTAYYVQWYNIKNGEISIKSETAPEIFLGLGRDKLVQEINNYNKNPSLTDLEKGFTHMEMVSFSPEKTVVRKNFEPLEEKGFFLVNEDHLVVVYDYRLKQIYLNTNILVEDLPVELQKEILHMKYVETEKELYNFLESYSS